jgi:hypothetical protein
LQKNRLISSSAAFLAAFAAYEGALFAISAISANGLSNFAPAIVLPIFLINAAAFAALFLVRRAMAAGGLADEAEVRLSAREQRA